MTIWALPARAAPPEIVADGALATDTGHILLEWTASEPVTLTIAQQPDMSDARPLYQGSEDSFFLSGLANGDYFLRLEGQGGELSAPVSLNVSHQSLSQALWLSVIGLFITLAIIGTILRGAKDD